MKHISTLLISLLVLSLMSFSGSDKKVVTKEIKTSESTVTWKGYKFTGSHHGTIAIKSGSLVFEDEKLTGGNFVIDMTTIDDQSLTGEYHDKLVGHLKSDDFFSVSKFETASMVFTKVTPKGKNGYEITADLTIKGKTLPVTFIAAIYGSKANATIKIDRSKYDVRYGSSSFFEGLADKVIYDEFDLVADIQF